MRTLFRYFVACMDHFGEWYCGESKVGKGWRGLVWWEKVFILVIEFWYFGVFAVLLFAVFGVAEVIENILF